LSVRKKKRATANPSRRNADSIVEVVAQNWQVKMATGRSRLWLSLSIFFQQENKSSIQEETRHHGANL